MSEGFEPQTGILGNAQAGTPTEAASGARVDIQGAVPTDFTGRTSEGGVKTGWRGALWSRIESSVREDPWQAVFAGFLLGLVFGQGTRSKAREVRREYVEPTVDRAQATMLATLVALTAGCRSLWRSTSMKTHDVVESARGYSKPLAKAARRMTHRAQRKLHVGRTSFLWH